MAEKFRVVFAGLSEQTDQTQAVTKLSDKLKTQPEKVTAFLQGKPLFVACDKDKALKQAKLLISLGIKSKLQQVNNNATESTSTESDRARDERIFNALDYITSSLIRLEEKLDDLEQRLPEQERQALNDQHDDWQDDDPLLDEELTISPKKHSKTLLYSLIAMVVLLLVLLGLSFMFPELLTFLDS